MADRDPVAGCRFRVRLVEIGPRGGERRHRELDVREVVLPAFRRRGSAGAAELPPPAATDGQHLILRRGHTGDPYLYDWWDEERNPKHRGSRSIDVEVLDGNGAAVTAWRFTGCHLVELRYSPLDALVSEVLMEVAEIGVGSVEQLAARR